MKTLGFIIGMLLCGVISADDLGRLFTTSTERANLNQGGDQERSSGRSKTDEIRLQGTIRNHQGNAHAWINGQPLERQGSVDGVTLLRIDEKGAGLRIADDNHSFILRPGQTWRAGRTEEGFARKPSLIQEKGD